MVAELTDPQRRQKLYAYAAEYLGKSKADVDHDVGQSVWNLRDDLTSEEQEKLYEAQDAAIDGEYHYGIDIAYLAADDRGNPFREEALIELTATFTAPTAMRSEDLARLYVLPAALSDGLIELLAQWACDHFRSQ